MEKAMIVNMPANQSDKTLRERHEEFRNDMAKELSNAYQKRYMKKKENK